MTQRHLKYTEILTNGVLKMNKVFLPANILLPENADMTKWSTVACDQYSSEPEYWNRIEKNTEGALTTYELIFPECFLGQDDDKRIEKINSKMIEYLPFLKEHPDSLIFLKRTLPTGQVRLGIVGCVDLEEYDFAKGSVSNIRATEGTVLERIPPRVKIRENASLELPHIMLLIDDRKNSVIEPLEGSLKDKIYDFELMEQSGHVEGYLLSKEQQEAVFEALALLDSENEKKSKYGNLAQKAMLFAVGDGNHSLATAKTCYENLKKELGEAALNHPARYALCEVENLHSEALEFKPIHRVVFDCDPEALISQLEEYCKNLKGDFPCQKLKYLHADGEGEVLVPSPVSPLEVGTLQAFLDTVDNIKVDFIHGDDTTKNFGLQKGNVGFILPSMPKDMLFKSVIADGALPRKTFSMGEACEKRFYIEARKIK